MQTEIANANTNAILVPLADTAVNLFHLPPAEFKKFVPELIAEYAGYSDAELERDFLSYKETYDELCSRGILGEANPGDLFMENLLENLFAVARCQLTVAYRRGLQWALDGVHKAKPMATA